MRSLVVVVVAVDVNVDENLIALNLDREEKDPAVAFPVRENLADRAVCGSATFSNSRLDIFTLMMICLALFFKYLLLKSREVRHFRNLLPTVVARPSQGSPSEHDRHCKSS